MTASIHPKIQSVLTLGLGLTVLVVGGLLSALHLSGAAEGSSGVHMITVYGGVITLLGGLSFLMHKQSEAWLIQNSFLAGVALSALFVIGVIAYRLFTGAF